MAEQEPTQEKTPIVTEGQTNTSSSAPKPTITKADPPTAESQNTETPKPIMIPKDRFDEVNDKRKTAEAELQTYREAQANAELDSKKKQGKFEELYQETLARTQELETSIATQALNQVKMQVATQAGYPQLWNRLAGSNEEEVQADIAAFVESLPKPQAPSLDGGAGAGRRDQSPTGEITKEYAEMLKSKYGIQTKYLE